MLGVQHDVGPQHVGMRQCSALTAVIGAGLADLASSYTLARRNLVHVVLERGEAVGHSWSNVYESLRLPTGKHFGRDRREVSFGTTSIYRINYLRLATGQF